MKRTCNDVYTYIKCRQYSPNETAFTLRKTISGTYSDEGENHTCSRLQKSKSNCSLHVIHPQLLKRNQHFCIYSFGLQTWYIYGDTVCTSADTRRFSPVALRLIQHRPVPRRASSDMIRNFWKYLALFRHRMMPGQAPYGAQTVVVEIVRFKCSPKVVRCQYDVCNLP